MADSKSNSGRDRHRLHYKKTVRRPRSQSPNPASKGIVYEETEERLNADDEAFYASGPAFHLEPTKASNYEAEDFTERLFDAMADDEGRDYWQNVYGQPIHDFPVDREMTDDEYAAYVRRGMWERKHADRAHTYRRREPSPHTRRDKHAEFIMREERERIGREDAALQLSLADRWKDYLRSWEELGAQKWTLKQVPWPILSGRTEDISRQQIQTFLMHAGPLKTIAKEELRRRWHPDRFQQRAEKHLVESDRKDILQFVTSVAQSLNHLIGE